MTRSPKSRSKNNGEARAKGPARVKRRVPTARASVANPKTPARTTKRAAKPRSKTAEKTAKVVQAPNPVTGRYMKLDGKTGAVLSSRHRSKPYAAIPIKR